MPFKVPKRLTWNFEHVDTHLLDNFAVIVNDETVCVSYVTFWFLQIKWVYSTDWWRKKFSVSDNGNILDSTDDVMV